MNSDNGEVLEKETEKGTVGEVSCEQREMRSDEVGRDTGTVVEREVEKENYCKGKEKNEDCSVENENKGEKRGGWEKM